jgi:hypothetical protein
MRTWGRQFNGDGSYQWIEVTEDANGFTDNIYLTTLFQALKLNLGESPFYAGYGIPQYQTIVTQTFPDFYAAQTQTQFAPHFASLTIIRVPGSFPPVYNVNATCHSGAILNTQLFTTIGTPGALLDGSGDPFILNQSTLS